MARTRPITVKVRTSRKRAEALRLEVARLAAQLGVPASVSVRRARGRAKPASG